MRVSRCLLHLRFRYVFFVQLGGFDNHDELLDNQAGLLGNLDANLKAFWDEMTAQGLQDDVTLFTCSDFGRTLPTRLIIIIR